MSLAPTTRIRYLVHRLPLDTGDGFQPFSLELPHDIVSIEGLAVTTDVRVNVAGGDSMPTTLLGSIPAQVAAAQAQYERTNLLPGKFRYRLTEPPYEPVWEELALNRFLLGTLSLRSYEASGAFYSQGVLPARFELCFSTEYGGLARGNLRLQELGYKSRIFTPVWVEGRSRELRGFFQASDFGRKLVAEPSPSQRVQEDFYYPGHITLLLRCHASRADPTPA